MVRRSSACTARLTAATATQSIPECIEERLAKSCLEYGAGNSQDRAMATERVRFEVVVPTRRAPRTRSARLPRLAREELQISLRDCPAPRLEALPHDPVAKILGVVLRELDAIDERPFPIGNNSLGCISEDAPEFDELVLREILEDSCQAPQAGAGRLKRGPEPRGRRPVSVHRRPISSPDCQTTLFGPHDATFDFRHPRVARDRSEKTTAETKSVLASAPSSTSRRQRKPVRVASISGSRLPAAALGK